MASTLNQHTCRHVIRVPLGWIMGHVEAQPKDWRTYE